MFAVEDLGSLPRRMKSRAAILCEGGLDALMTVGTDTEDERNSGSRDDEEVRRSECLRQRAV
jgi:hypothetical protein